MTIMNLLYAKLFIKSKVSQFGSMELRMLINIPFVVVECLTQIKQTALCSTIYIYETKNKKRTCRHAPKVDTLFFINKIILIGTKKYMIDNHTTIRYSFFKFTVLPFFLIIYKWRLEVYISWIQAKLNQNISLLANISLHSISRVVRVLNIITC